MEKENQLIPSNLSKKTLNYNYKLLALLYHPDKYISFEKIISDTMEECFKILGWANDKANKLLELQADRREAAAAATAAETSRATSRAAAEAEAKAGAEAAAEYTKAAHNLYVAADRLTIIAAKAAKGSVEAAAVLAAASAALDVASDALDVAIAKEAKRKAAQEKTGKAVSKIYAAPFAAADGMAKIGKAKAAAAKAAAAPPKTAEEEAEEARAAEAAARAAEAEAAERARDEKIKREKKLQNDFITHIKNVKYVVSTIQSLAIKIAIKIVKDEINERQINSNELYLLEFTRICNEFIQYFWVFRGQNISNYFGEPLDSIKERLLKPVWDNILKDQIKFWKEKQEANISRKASKVRAFSKSGNFPVRNNLFD
jgi:hypothetical protein